MKITRIRIYRPHNLNLYFNQSNKLVTVETEDGLTGIGEDANRIQHLWQHLCDGYFEPASLEKKERSEISYPLMKQ
jgi:general stress protein 26